MGMKPGDVGNGAQSMIDRVRHGDLDIVLIC